MAFVVAALFFVGVFVPLRWILRATGSPYRHARGFVLSASQAATEGMDPYGRRCMTRLMSVEVDPIDAEPYQMLLNAPVPTFCDVLPGTSLDLLVQEANRNNVIVVGPLGSNQWVRAVTLLPQLPTTLERGMNRSTMTAIPFVVAGLAALIAVMALTFGAE